MIKPQDKHLNLGFTTLELLIVISILGAVASLSLFFGMDSLRSYQIHSQKAQVLSMLQTARQKSMSNELEKAYGVRVEAGQVTLFESPFGSSPTTDYAIPITGDVVATAGTLPLDITFEQLSGTTTEASFTLQNSGANSFSVNINSNGAILW